MSDEFSPFDLRDWNDLNACYKCPEDGPSDARIEGEKLLKYCDKILETPEESRTIPTNDNSKAVSTNKCLFDKYINSTRRVDLYDLLKKKNIEEEFEDNNAYNQNSNDFMSHEASSKVEEVLTDDDRYYPPEKSPKIEEMSP